MLQKFREYQNQIWEAIRRFPVVTAFAVYAAAAFTAFYLIEDRFNLWLLTDEPLARVLNILLLHPLTSMSIAYAFAVRKETAKRNFTRLHIGAQAAWAICLIINQSVFIDPVVPATFIIAICTIASPLLLPFWEKRDDLNTWKFMGSNLKALAIAALTTAILNGAIAFLYFAIEVLFSFETPEEMYVISAIICWAAICPIFFLAGLPEFANSDDQPIQLHSKFLANALHFLFIPILLLYIGFLYAYGIKILLFDAEYGMIPLFVSIAIVSTLVITTILYPSHFDDGRKLDRRLLLALPILNVPIVIFAAYDFIQSIQDENIVSSSLYIIYFIVWFLAACAISIFSVKRKIRLLVISLCTFFAIYLVGPLNFHRIAHMISAHKLTDLLNQNGYTSFPLTCEQYRELYTSLRKDGRHSDKHSFEAVKNDFALSGNGSDLAKFFPVENCGIPSEQDDSDKEDSLPKFIYSASNLVTVPYDFPTNRSKAFPLELSVDEDGIEIKDSILSFKIKPFPNDSVSVLEYSVPIGTLKTLDSTKEQKSPLVIDNETSTLVIQEFDLFYNKYSKRWQISGALYLQ